MVYLALLQVFCLINKEINANKYVRALNSPGTFTNSMMAWIFAILMPFSAADLGNVMNYSATDMNEGKTLFNW